MPVTSRLRLCYGDGSPDAEASRLAAPLTRRWHKRLNVACASGFGLPRSHRQAIECAENCPRDGREEPATIRRPMTGVGHGDGEISPDVLAACRNGDRDALRALYEAHKDKVYSIAFYFFHGDAAAAGDVTQQVFLKLIGGMAKYRGDSAFSTWLYRIVVNACVDDARRRKGETSAITEPAVLDAIPDPMTSHDELF